MFSFKTSNSDLQCQNMRMSMGKYIHSFHYTRATSVYFFENRNLIYYYKN